MILAKYDKEEDLLEVIQEGKERGFIQKTGSESGKEKKERGPSRWSAYQGECKRRAAAEGKPHLKRDRMKEIWNSEDYKQFHEEWDRVAKELNSGKSFREIVMPKIPDLDDDYYSSLPLAENKWVNKISKNLTDVPQEAEDEQEIGVEDLQH